MSLVETLRLHQQIAPPQIAVVEAPEHFERAVGMHAAQVLGAEERAAGDIAEIDDIDPPVRPGDKTVKGSLGSRTVTRIQGGQR